jgi:hypothetical protein
MTGPALASAAVALLIAAPAKERVDDVVQRAGQWVQQFEHDFITVIADETYEQSVLRGELSGRIWSRAADGAVLRTMMELMGQPANGLTGLKTTITVDYAPDAKLRMIVPARMEEEYRDYSNYRVFETSARVIVPQ